MELELTTTLNDFYIDIVNWSCNISMVLVFLCLIGLDLNITMVFFISLQTYLKNFT